MKKFLSILMTALLVFSCGAVFAMGTPITIVAPTDTGMQTIAGKIIGAIQVVGYLIAAGMIVFIGIKYIMASASEKAELKGLLVKYVIGAALIVFGVTIASWIFNLGGGATPTTPAS